MKRPGTTLIELLIFVALISLIVALALPLLFSSTEHRMLQQTVSIVEQNGTQILQNVTLRARRSERILKPLPGQTGSVLALQTGSGATNPTLIGLSSGAIVIVEHKTRETVSSPQVAVQDFIVRNTSTSAGRQSLQISFRIARTIRLQMPHSYTQYFEAGIALLPDGCELPACSGANRYQWQVCETGVCLTATTPLQCP